MSRVNYQQNLPICIESTPEKILQIERGFFDVSTTAANMAAKNDNNRPLSAAMKSLASNLASQVVKFQDNLPEYNDKNSDLSGGTNIRQINPITIIDSVGIFLNEFLGSLNLEKIFEIRPNLLDIESKK